MKRRRFKSSIARGRCSNCGRDKSSDARTITGATALRAFDIATGKVIGRVTEKHRAQEFLAFLEQIENAVPERQRLHLILDNSITHTTVEVKAFLASHPRMHLHFTPTSASWLSAVEGWFSQLERRVLRCSVLTRIQELLREPRVTARTALSFVRMTYRKAITWGQLGTRWLCILTFIVGFALLVARVARYLFWKEYPWAQ